nr:MAG TPA: Tweety [Caudoviricetes sp.]
MVWYRLMVGLLFFGLGALAITIILHGAESRREYWLLVCIVLGYMGLAVYWLMMGVL